MTSRAFFHYLLSFAVLFASSLAAFHTSEHIGGDRSNHDALNFSSLYSSSIHNGLHQSGDSNHHDGHSHDSLSSLHKDLTANSSDAPGTHHGVESLCEECIFLSSLIAPAHHGSYLYISLLKDSYGLVDTATYASLSFHSYRSRAPPLNT